MSYKYQKKAGETISISEKVDFRGKKISTDIELYITIKG